jgi:L-ascorbate metabolism protein UlaG (beta-lactamase superfamily)
MWSRSHLYLEPGASYGSGFPFPFSRGEDTAVFIGHSTVLLRLNGQNFLTDPVYLKRLFILKRHGPPGVPFQNLPDLDFILVSHGHLDHMDLPTLGLFPRHLPIVVPKRLEGYLTRMGFQDVRPLLWGEQTRIGSLRILALPVKHHPGRSLAETRSVPQSYLVHGTKNVFFAGDSAFTEKFREIGRRFDIDLALLPIGNYRPAIFRSMHMSPEDALTAMELLRAKRMVPIHWGTFRLSLESVEDPPRRFAALLQQRRINPRAMLLLPGERANF